MIAMSDEPASDSPVAVILVVARLLLSVLLCFVALYGFTQLAVVATVASAANSVAETSWTTVGRGMGFLLFLLVAIGGVIALRPWNAINGRDSNARNDGAPVSLTNKVIAIFLVMMALFGLAAAAGLLAGLLFAPSATYPSNALAWIVTLANLFVYLLIAGSGLWGLARLKPWSKAEPVSPATRKTNTLFGLSGLIATASCLTVIFGSWSQGGVSALFSNGPLPLWIAIFAIPTWMISWGLSWMWYESADEHEKRASDIGLLVGGLLFALVTPIWWVAARAGLTPQPNAMILWFIVNLAWGVGWFWRRNR